MATLLRTSIVLAHRYLGIALGLLVIMWFATGITMMYAGGMPVLTPQQRLDRLPDLDLDRVQLTPAGAAARADDVTFGVQGQVKLLTVLNRPAYRIGGETVFADTGERFAGADLAQSRSIAAGFLRLTDDRVHHVATLSQVDQWTLVQSQSLPLHKFRADDEAGSEIYVQPRTGEVAMLTTRRSRTLAWISTIPHWLYFTALREHQPLWYRLIVWTSAAACALAVLGLILGVVQFRRTRPFRLSRAIPYSGWMRWHYVSGAIFGVFTLTWAFSGLLSMEPFAWTNSPGLAISGDAMTGGPPDLSRFTAVDRETWQQVLGDRQIREMEFTRLQNRHHYVVRLAPADPRLESKRERLHQPYYVTVPLEQDRVLVAADTLVARREPFASEALLARLEAAAPGVPVVASELLTDYDSYYYSRARQTPLPVLRVTFGDPDETWVYVDPQMGQVLARVDRFSRVVRWLYNGLHSLDFAFWYRSRLWDIAMIVLLLGGLTTSGLGVVMGIRRLRRNTARAARAWTAAAPSARPDEALPAGTRYSTKPGGR
jgi:uncharacterized iron-regulated membrane protein